MYVHFFGKLSRYMVADKCPAMNKDGNDESSTPKTKRDSRIRKETEQVRVSPIWRGYARNSPATLPFTVAGARRIP